MAPKAPPPLSIRSLLPFTVVSLASLALLSLTWASLPELVADRAIPSANANHRLVRPDGPLWYWLLALSPVGLTVVTAVIATVRFPGIAPRGWLAVALTLLAGAQVHNAVWPSTYATVLTSASMLRLAFSLLIVAGAILEFRRIAAEYEAAIDSEREYARRLSELAALRADFTSMVSHEIGSPLAAIRAYADILDQERFDAAIRQEATATIRDQVDHLRNLVHDIATIATIESDHFDVRPFEIPLNLILADGAAFAASLPGNHPFICSLRTPERIVVDPVRIAQVLRNLLGNAANYSPPGTPIELRTERVRERVRIEVVDHGYGIPEDDLDRIFEKFGRSSADYSRSVSGTGLGLYISRRIVEAHGSRLTVSSKPGVGSVFGFEIEVAR